MSKERQIEVDFTLRPEGKVLQGPRYLPQPDNWGPKSRAGGLKRKGTDKKDSEEKKRKTQYCKHFAAGHCRYGDACIFLHETPKTD